MPIKSLAIALIVLVSWSAACGVEVRREITPSPAPRRMTATLAATSTPVPSERPLPPPPQPTMAPVDGVTSTQVNVRAEPSTAGTVLGIIAADMRVEITGKDPSENWWQINYPQAADGKGWVTAQYVVASNRDQIPVIGDGDAGTPAGPNAVVQQQINVRSGPGTDFNSLGTLNPQDVVQLTGKDSNGAWLQVEFPAGPEGQGWVNAAFVQAHGVENLPIITEAGVMIGTATPTEIPPTATATVVPAWEDNDSPNNPIVRVIFEPAGTQTLIYNGDLSSPEGDTADWVAFTPHVPFVFVSLACRGGGSIRVEMTENTVPVDANIECGNSLSQVAVEPGSDYLVHLEAGPSGERLQYTSYVLTIKTKP